MKRTNGEILRDLRKKENLTMEELANKLEVTASFVNGMEKDKKAIPEKIVEKMITILGASKKDMEELRQNIIEKEVPEILRQNIKDGNFEEVKIKEFKYHMYNFNSEEDGFIDRENYTEYIEARDIETGNKILKNCIVIKVLGNSSAPNFFNNDIIAFLKSDFENWQKLDKKIILIEIEKKLYMKKIIFEDGEPYLHTFNDRLYPKQKISEIKSIKYIGKPKYRLNINLDNFTL